MATRKGMNVKRKVTRHLQVLFDALTDADESRRSLASAYATRVIRVSLLRRVVKELADTLPYGGSVARQATASLADIGQPAIPVIVSRVKESRELAGCNALIETLGTIGARIDTSERIDLCSQLENLRDTTEHPAIAAALNRAIDRVWQAGPAAPAGQPWEGVVIDAEGLFTVT